MIFSTNPGDIKISFFSSISFSFSCALYNCLIVSIEILYYIFFAVSIVNITKYDFSRRIRYFNNFLLALRAIFYMKYDSYRI